MIILKCPEIRFKNDDGNNYPNWEDKKLDNVFKFYKGKGISKIELSEEGIPCIIYGELYTKYREVIGVVKSKTNIKKELLFMSEIGDILIPSSGETQKDIATASTVMEKNVALGGDINILRSKETINSPYVSYYLKHIKNIEISKLSQGNSVVHLYSKQLSNLKIEIPHLEEQQKIGDFFMLLDKRIEQQEQKIALLKDYKKAMMQKIFSQKIRFKDENGNDYPDWEEKKLGEMFEVKKGIQISKKNLSLNGQKCILYGELFTRYDEIIEDVTSKTDLDILPNSKYHDILMPSSDVTPNGLAKASCLLENDVILGGDINILRYKNKKIFPPFFSYQINYYKKKIMDVVSGTTIKHVYSKNIEKLNYKLPLCIDEQEKITSFLLAIENNIKTQKEMVETLKKEKISLLNKMFV